MGFINPINPGLFHEIKNPPFVICSNYMLYFGGRQKSLKWCYTPKFHVITCYFFSPFFLTKSSSARTRVVRSSLMARCSAIKGKNTFAISFVSRPVHCCTMLIPRLKCLKFFARGIDAKRWSTPGFPIFHWTQRIACPLKRPL